MTHRTTQSLKTIFAEIKDLQRRFKQSKTQYRDSLYGTMQQVQLLAAALRKDNKMQRGFWRKIKKKFKKAKGANLTLEVMALVTNARSRAARKLAWKRSRVLDYLRSTGVRLDETAKGIKSRGGIERIVKEVSRGDSAKISQRHKSKPANAIATNNPDLIVPVYFRLADRDAILDLNVGSVIKLTAIRIGQRNADLKITRVVTKRESD